MNFLRLFLVVTLVTLVGGVFGATVGGLLGFAAPNSLEGFFGMEVAHGDPPPPVTNRTPPTPPDEAATGYTQRARLGVGDPQRANFAASGAALGGASGLVIAAMFGIGIGLLDQGLLAWRQWSGASGVGRAGAEPSANLPHR